MELMLVILATILFILFLATVGLALYYFGLFEDVQVNVGSSPVAFNGQTVAYKQARGPYNKSGHLFTELTGDLARIIPDKSSDSLKTIGFYYDDPLETRESRLRYVVGVIFPEEGQEEWTEDKITSLRDGLLAKEYKLTTLPKIDHVVYTTFPFRSSLSIVIAVKRVYPIIRAYVSRHNLCAHPALEVYTPEFIYFILPLSKQDHFYLFDSDEEEEEVEGDNIPFSSGSETDEEVSDFEAGTNSEEDLDRDLKTEGRSKKSNTKTSLRHRETGVRKSSQTSTQNSSSSFEEINVSEKDK